MRKAPFGLNPKRFKERHTISIDDPNTRNPNYSYADGIANKSKYHILSTSIGFIGGNIPIGGFFQLELFIFAIEIYGVGLGSGVSGRVYADRKRRT